MAATLKFGPEWLRQLSSGGSMTSPPPSPSFGGKYKLAEYRYGREEMLALFTPNPKAPDDLRQYSAILIERCQDPMAMIAPTEEEQRLLASNVNSTAVFRQVMGRGGRSDAGPPGMRGAGRGGGLSTRGRGRGRGEPGGFYQRGFDDPIPGRGETYRGRGGREGGATKVIERDSSGFLSARTFDEVSDRRARDPLSKSTPSGDRWSELRSGGRDTGRAPPEQSEEPGTPGTPRDGDDKEDDWRRAGKDRQPRGNWRDAKPSFDDDSGARYQRGGGFSRQTSYNDRRQRHDDDELPEWATDDMGGGDEGGTFDSSGAFMSLKEFDDPNTPEHNGDTVKTSSNKKQETPKSRDQAKKSLPPLHIDRTSSTKDQTNGGSPVDNKPKQEPQKPSETTDKKQTTNEQSPPQTTKQTPSKTDTDKKGDSSLPKTTQAREVNTSTKSSPAAPSSAAPDAEPAEADFDHLTKAAEEMMATWAAEDDDHAPPVVEEKSHPQLEPNNPTGAPELADSWFYKDPQGTLQGPFTAQEMAEWFSAGYFTMTLLVKQGRDLTFQPLGEIIKRCGGRQPFIPTPSVPAGLAANQMAANDPAIIQAHQDPHALQQQMFLLQQQALVQQQQQQAALIRILQTLSTSEEYKQLPPQQLQTVAMAILVKEQQKQQVLLAQQTQQALLEATRNSLAVVSQQSSPPNQHHPGLPQQSQGQQHMVNQEDDMLWGNAWNKQLREKQALDEIAQKEAARQQEQQRIESLRQRERETQLMEERRIQEERRLKEERRLHEERRMQEDRAKEEIRRQELEMEKQLREKEERKRQEIEKQEMERQKQIERQIELERQREAERQRLIEIERQKEVDRKIEMEAKKKAEQQKQREAEERKHREIMEAEMARRAEQQRQETERVERERQQAAQEKERERQAERERLEALQLPSTAQWASGNGSTNVGLDRQLSLQEIQKREREQAEKERAARAAAEKQRQQEEQSLTQTQLKWAASNTSRSPVTAGKSLREIQEEEAIRLEKERKEKAKQKAAIAPTTNLVGSSWGGGKPSTTGWANEGAWGNAAKKGTWEQPASNKPVRTANSELFPSLSATAKPQQSASANSQQQKKKPANPSQSNKKNAQNDKVHKMFQNAMSNQSTDDKFTEWCKNSLKSLNASVDVDTFVTFLREVESPFEVQDYVKSYLGDTPKSTQFAKDFVERRSVANKRRQAKQREEEESLWGPAPAVNPAVQRTAAEQANNSSANEKKKKAAKKPKGQKMDATALLGFTVGASRDRLNIGEIEKAE